MESNHICIYLSPNSDFRPVYMSSPFILFHPVFRFPSAAPNETNNNVVVTIFWRHGQVSQDSCSEIHFHHILSSGSLADYLRAGALVDIFGLCGLLNQIQAVTLGELYARDTAKESS